MNPAVALLLFLPAIGMLTLACLPSSKANARVSGFRRAVTLTAGFQSLLAISFAGLIATGYLPAISTDLVRLESSSLFAVSIYYDGISSLMFVLVSFVGWVICRYSIRYLDGEPTQGRYFRWTAFTLGSVSLMVIAGNLLMFFVLWVMTSLGLHQLLMHYSDRPAAKRSAWTKFAISRFGDVALVAAMVLIYAQFQTLDFAELFTAAGTLAQTTPGIQLAGFLLVMGAITKSAQFPFHTWLPLTMETPTPVSALMHAGIVNAGGYLILRMSPLVALAPWALTTLIGIGGLTAVFGAVVMLTQTSVKKSLAYSTIAQMGFMLLQCGLGAYSAAMLHILAHSLYKAHAFLSSGSRLVEGSRSAPVESVHASTSYLRVAILAPTLLGALLASLALFGIDILDKPGGVLLGGLLVLALTYWTEQVLRKGGWALRLRALAVAIVLSFVYAASYFAVDRVISSGLPQAAPGLTWPIVTIVLLGLAGLFALQLAIAGGSQSTRLATLRIHAANGFYVESVLRRMAALRTS